MAESDYLAVLVTISDSEAGRTLSQILIEERLAACAQVIPGGIAIYRWKGDIHADPQTQVILKTRAATWPRLRDRVVALHPDEVPEILALPIVDGLPAYLRWMDEEVAPQAPQEPGSQP